MCVVNNINLGIQCVLNAQQFRLPEADEGSKVIVFQMAISWMSKV